MKRLVFLALLIAVPLSAQDTTAARGRGAGRGGRGGGGRGQLTPITDTLRAHELFVSKSFKVVGAN